MWIFHRIVQEENTVFHVIKDTCRPLISFPGHFNQELREELGKEWSSGEIPSVLQQQCQEHHSPVKDERPTSELTEEHFSGSIPLYLHVSTL